MIKVIALLDIALYKQQEIIYQDCEQRVYSAGRQRKVTSPETNTVSNDIADAILWVTHTERARAIHAPFNFLDHDPRSHTEPGVSIHPLVNACVCS